jgi:2-polyprenyl-3-methyl-5-hydroxy-6-metoxy-1,4-benzoquinol methylase
MMETCSESASLTSRVDRYIHFDRASRPYLEWQIARFLPHIGQRVLEVGCGVGSIIELLGERELICGIDVDEEVLAYTSARFPNRTRFDFRRLDFSALSASEINSMRETGFDTIVSLNVLEHIRDDVGALRAMREIVHPGGQLVLLVPAHPALYGEYDRLDGHFRRYTKRTFTSVLRTAGFTKYSLRYFNAVGALGWWTKYKLLRSSIHGSGDFQLMNAAIQVLQPLERIISPPFGLSVTAIVTR